MQPPRPTSLTHSRPTGKGHTVPAAAESRNRAKPHRAAEGSWSNGPPPRGGISGDNSKCNQGWSGGGSPGGADVPRLSQLPPLALVRSRECATSAVNACVDGAKPTAGIVPDVGRYASFSGLRKKVQHERRITMERTTMPTDIFLVNSHVWVICSLASCAAVSRIRRILERRMGLCAAARRPPAGRGLRGPFHPP